MAAFPSRLPVCALALSLAFNAACGGARLGARQAEAGAPSLQITGTARLVELTDMGMEHLEVSLLLKNPGAPRRLVRTSLLLASEGGWSFSLGDRLSQRGSFFGVRPSLAASLERRLDLTYYWSSPIVSFLLRVDAIDEDGTPEEHFVQLPVARKGFTAPEELPLNGDGFLALSGPLEVVPLSNDKRWLALTGQVVNVTGRPLTLTRFELVAEREDGGVILSRDLRASFPIANDDATVVPFLYGVEIPSGVAGGRVTLDATVRLDGDKRERHFKRALPFRDAELLRVSPPVHGTWLFRNGPGDLTLSAHTPWPEQRYAYDLSIVREISGKRSTFEGDAKKNESFFAWDKPFFAAADGTVVEVVDDVTDNAGRTADMGRRDARNARIVLRHGEDRFTVYVHLRKGSALVKVGQVVKAGDMLGHVGNAGFSTEPHLHFAAFKINTTGRPQALPMEVVPLRTEKGEPVSGVPVSGVLYACGVDET